MNDLEVVVESAGLERFVLMGISQGSAVSIAYAHRHPEKIAGLILFGGYPRGWRYRGDAAEIQRREAMVDLIRIGWGQDNPAFRQTFTSLYIPGAGEEERAWFNELQRTTTTPENAAKIMEVIGAINVDALLPELIFMGQEVVVSPTPTERDNRGVLQQ